MNIPGWAIIAVIMAASGLAGAILLLALRNSRSQLSHERVLLTFDSMKAGICLWDKNLRLVFCNKQYLRMKDATPDQMRPGRSYRELLLQSANAANFKGDPHAFVEKIIEAVTHEDGSSQIIPLANGDVHEVTSRPLGDGYLVTVEDITARYRAEEANRIRRETGDRAAEAFKAKLESAVAVVNRSLSSLGKTAAELLESSTLTSSQAASAVTSSRSASDNVMSVAAAAAQLKNSINKISMQITQTAGVIRDAVHHTGKAGEDLSDLESSVRRIGDVAGLIGNIAHQTNLLALNATIEASRAGEAGKGFEVVAAEVKSLAVQTSKATEDISQRILLIQSSTARTSNAMETLSFKIEEISHFANSVASAMEEQGAATRAISETTMSVSDETGRVTNILAEVAQAAETTKGASETVLGSSEAVQAAIEVLQIDVSEFFRKIAV